MSKLASFVLLIVVLCLIAVIAQSVPSSEEPRQPDIHQVFYKSPEKDNRKKVKYSSTSTGLLLVYEYRSSPDISGLHTDTVYSCVTAMSEI